MEANPLDEGRLVLIECARYAVGEISWEQLEATVKAFEFGPSGRPDFTRGWVDEGFFARFPVPGSIDELVAAQHYLTEGEADHLYRLAYNQRQARRQVSSAN